MAYSLNLRAFTSALKLSALGSALNMTSTSLTNGEIDDRSYLLVRILNPRKSSLGIFPDLTKNWILCLSKTGLLKSQTRPNLSVMAPSKYPGIRSSLLTATLYFWLHCSTIILHMLSAVLLYPNMSYIRVWQLSKRIVLTRFKETSFSSSRGKLAIRWLSSLLKMAEKTEATSSVMKTFLT